MSRLPKPETELRKARAEIRKLRRENDAKKREINELRTLVASARIEASKWEERFDNLLRSTITEQKAGRPR